MKKVDNSGRESGDDRKDESSCRPKAYVRPRIEKKRPVSRATLFTGSGPDTGGVISAG